MLNQSDYQQLEEKGISVARIVEQLQFFEHGFPHLEIAASASVNKGIKVVSETEQAAFRRCWEDYLGGNPRVVKFVPASGAASRMFKDLFEFAASGADSFETPFLKKFFANIERFAFSRQLDAACRKRFDGRGIAELTSAGRYRDVVNCLLTADGLNYGALPKGLLLFHRYPDGCRTAMEEHLVEGAGYAAAANRTVNIHFTVSPEHQPLFEALAKDRARDYADRLGVTFNLSFSCQKPSTDTIAVDADNEPFRDGGRLVFRPGGHGALIENLNDIDADVVFIKNIDNVATDRLLPETIRYKQLLAGVLVDCQRRIFQYIRQIDSGRFTREQLIEILYFVQNELCIKNPETKLLEDAELALYLRAKLNRPLRVCGMVRNESEPGGGPFLAVNPDGTVSPQILESSQIDLDNPRDRAAFEQGTFFNPVDLVCGLRDFAGQRFDLRRYVDPNTGFISHKSKNGRPLKALELPGLWNGAMSDWNTIFAEVPKSTFNPVKTVNDLLKTEHQG